MTEVREPASAAEHQAIGNRATWSAGAHLPEYAGRDLRPVEVVLLARYRGRLSRSVLEIGVGGGRVLGYLVALGGDVHGLDLSPSMVDYCRQHYPEAELHVGDLARLETYGQGPFDVVLMTFNVIDGLDDATRRKVLAGTRELLAPDGLLIFSSHNLDAVDRPAAKEASRPMDRLGRVLDRTPRRAARALLRTPRRIRNRRVMRGLEHRDEHYAILNDCEQDYSLLHYYIRRDEQQRQLNELGYELVECLDLQGNPVPRGSLSRDSELHYVAELA